jgi:hypothetical protein
LLAVVQASRFEGLSFDPFHLFYNGLITAEVHIAHATVMVRNSDMFAEDKFNVKA